jgi:anti-anti-sigma factor
MERHHMKMAVSVITRNDDDALRISAVGQTQTAFNNETHVPVALGEADLAPSRVAGRMHTLVLTGSLDRRSAHQLETEIERLCAEGVTGITLDLRELAHIEAIGVAVVAFRCRLCRRRGYDFALIRGPRAVQLVFEQAGLSELLPFTDSRTPLHERPALHERTPVEEDVSEERVAEKPARQPALVLTPRLEPVVSGELR